MAKRKARRRLLLAACLLAVLLIPSAQATPIVLDPTFGSGGTATTAIGLEGAVADALVLQPDGKLVAAGSANEFLDFALARYSPDGSLDTSFNGTGEVTTAIDPGYAVAHALVLQPDGKLVAAGTSAGTSLNGPTEVFALARYNPDGTLDRDFGSGGKVTTAIGTIASAYALVLQPDGKLVAAGLSYDGSHEDFALARYNPDGSLDTSFGSGGKVTTAIGPLSEIVYALALQPDGKLVAAGSSYKGSGSNNVFALARYNRDGSLDSSFGSGGEVTTAIGTLSDVAYTLALQPDGKLVAGGSDFALARYNRDGSLDTSFGSGGKVTTKIGPNYSQANALKLDPDGKLVAAGYSHNGSNGDEFALARYNSDGSLDTSFNGTGTVTTAIGLGHDAASALVLQPDGKLVAAGAGWNGSKFVFALARYLPGSTLTVAKKGGGSGSVTSSPSGIACGATCAAPFAAVPVTLTATASAGSSFAGWSGDCSGTGTCTQTMNTDHSVTATFTAPCVVPKVTGKTLTAAKKAITRAHCSAGKVTGAFSAKVKKGRVISQHPKPGAQSPSGSKVALKVSKGKRR